MFSKRSNLARGFISYSQDSITHSSISKLSTSLSAPLFLTHSRSSSSAPSVPPCQERKSTDHSDFTPQNARFDLSAIGGSDEIIDNMTDIIRYLMDPGSFARLGAKLPSGILLSGPPGVGKTLWPEVIAGHADVPFYKIGGSDVTSMWSGETERKLREIFKEARKTGGVLCIDEIDSVGQKRKNPSDPDYHHHDTKVVNQLLKELTENNEGVVIFGTTNHPDALDPALKRPGRFDRHVVIPLPHAADREKILAVHTKDKALAPEVNLATLAKLSIGFSGAKLATWVNEAIIYATRAGHEKVSMVHFDQARALIQQGTQSRYSSHPDENRRIAIHEAAHAYIGHLLGEKIYKTSIAAHGNKYGYTEFMPEDEKVVLSKKEMLRKICIKLAGRAAEIEFDCELMNDKDDLAQAKEMAAEMVKKEGMGKTIIDIDHDTDMEEILQQEMHNARHLIQENGDMFEKIVKTLIEHRQLRDADFINILNNRPIEPQHYYQPNSKWIATLPKSNFKSASLKQTERFFSGTDAELSTDKLQTAIRLGSKDMVQAMLDKCTNKTKFDEFGGLALHIAANYGQAEIVILLLNSGIHFDAGFKTSALTLSRLYGHDDVVDILLNQKSEKQVPYYNSYHG